MPTASASLCPDLPTHTPPERLPEQLPSRESLAALRAHIAQLEGHAPLATPQDAGTVAPAAWTWGCAALDGALESGAARGLALGAVHEWAPATPADRAAPVGVVLRLLARLPRPGPLLWVQTAESAASHGRPYGPGLRDTGLDPQRLIHVRVATLSDGLWALEEGVRSGAVAAVVGVGLAPDFTASRRLALASGTSGVPCLLLPREAPSLSAAASRWRVAHRPSLPDPLDARSPGAPCWSLTLARARSAAPGSWAVTWHEPAHHFALAAPVADGAAAPAPGAVGAPAARHAA
jgi:protein ImuA